ncbi:MAG: succinate dehydrogenase, partial [Chloroflexi bacterium]|nr:succinate dehydrogenase [Chloroflexota bacterium]
MVSALTLYRTSIGKKVVMALTGLILVGFVVAHMVGNLKIFLGAEAINAYAGFLRDVGEPLLPRETLLWIARIVLLASVVLHITAATQLTIQDRAS